jgi:threonine dehydratase
LFAEMWDFAERVICSSLLTSVDEIRGAIRQLATSTAVVAEGAGAAAVAAAMAGRVTTVEGESARRIVCVVSGGNIDAGVLTEILGEAES